MKFLMQLQVLVSIMNSDYRSRDSLISRLAVMEFFLAQIADNCSFARSCLFEGESECDQWRTGDGVSVIDTKMSILPIQNPFTGSCLYAVPADSDAMMASTVINDAFCGVSFAYAVSTTAEIVVLVDGLESVWSSLVSPELSGWASETVQLDLQDVQVLQNRSISFLARLRGDDPAYVTLTYAALDNITLHPCLDCATPGESGGSQLVS